MNSQEITNCLKILRSQPPWFSFAKEDITAKLNCLKIFRQEGEPQDIVSLIELLKHSDSVLRDSAAETIIFLLKKMMSRTEFYESLKYADFEKDDFDYYKNTFSPDIYLHLLFIASLNLSGYIREKALNEIAQFQNPEAIKFIVFRLGDWVKNVRQAAKETIRLYFQPIFIDEFINQIPLIEWLLTVGRINLTDIYSEIYQFIFGFDLNETAYEKLNQLSDKTKVLYIRNYLTFKPLTEKFFRLLAGDKLFLVKIELLKHIEQLDEETQKRFINKFLKDRSAKVRVYAIYSTKPFREEFESQIYDSIFDISPSVRELARFILRDSAIDFADAYRQKLKVDKESIGAILGLSEVGTQTDLPVFQSYIEQPNVKIKVACLSAINRLNARLAGNYALDLLTHSSVKVRNKSIEVLASMPDDEVLERARNAYQIGTSEQRKSVLQLFSKIGGWKIVGDLIISLSDADEKIRRLGWINLEKWHNKQKFTKPSPEDSARTMKLYNQFDKSDLPSSRENFWSELPFYLR